MSEPKHSLYATPKPDPERTAAEERAGVNWEAIAATHEFQSLLRAKAKFIFPACLFFMVYYFALPLLVGYAPKLMTRKVWGTVNVAYLFALSQFLMAWIVAACYVLAAGRFDLQAKKIMTLAKVRGMLGRN